MRILVYLRPMQGRLARLYSLREISWYSDNGLVPLLKLKVTPDMRTPDED